MQKLKYFIIGRDAVKLRPPSHCDINAVDVGTEVPSELFGAFVDQADED